MDEDSFSLKGVKKGPIGLAELKDRAAQSFSRISTSGLEKNKIKMILSLPTIFFVINSYVFLFHF